jgi:phage repressor protein C with HTH and peptisase S24 domain
MSTIDQRGALERLIQERREDFAGLSRLLGRNPAYIQHFGVAPAALGARLAPVEDNLVRVGRYDIGASAGHGAINDRDLLVSHMAFDKTWLRQLCGSASARLSLVRVQGDSMDPTLSDGDEILVDESDALERLRDGIYVLRRDDTLMVKRIALSPAGRLVTIKSDNPAYPEWRDCALRDLQIIGRVLWTGHKLG